MDIRNEQRERESPLEQEESRKVTERGNKEQQGSQKEQRGHKRNSGDLKGTNATLDPQHNPESKSRRGRTQLHVDEYM